MKKSIARLVVAASSMHIECFPYNEKSNITDVINDEYKRCYTSTPVLWPEIEEKTKEYHRLLDESIAIFSL